MRLSASLLALALLATLLIPTASFAQTAPAVPEDDPDLDFSAVQPDFTLVSTLPTTLRLARFKSAFRVTHRFGRPLGAGDFGDLAGDRFGLEYRFGLMRGLQAGIHRTSNKTIEFFGQYNVLHEENSDAPIGLGILAAIDGTNNFRDVYSPSFGVVLSRNVGTVAALYVEPIWVGNTNPGLDILVDEDNTFLVGLAARVRVRPTVYLVGEMAPRVAGYDPGVTQGSFGIEKRAGGHSFQINISNGFGTTLSQLARGGFTNDEWFLGFNISRKFY
jgi:hypothetical protein